MLMKLSSDWVLCTDCGRDSKKETMATKVLQRFKSEIIPKQTDAITLICDQIPINVYP